MKTTKDYSKSPAKSFDALEDIRDYLGAARWEALYPQMKAVTHPRQFTFFCSIAGIEGFPVTAWYDHYHGQGALTKAWDELEAAGEAEVRWVEGASR